MKRALMGYRNAPTAAGCTREAVLRADSASEEGMTIEAVISTPARVRVLDRQEWEIIEEILLPEGMRVENGGEQVCLLDSHSRWSSQSVIGSAREIRNEGENTIARLHFIEGDEDSVRIWRRVSGGHLRSVSIGYLVLNAVRIPPGERANVNGVDYTAGNVTLRVATEWEIFEVSTVPVGANSEAKTRGGGSIMPAKLRQYLESIGLRSNADDHVAWQFYDGLKGDEQARAISLKIAHSEGGAGNPEPGNKPPEDPPGNPPDDDNPGQRSTSQPGNPPESSDVIAQRAIAAERDRVRQIRESGIGVVNEETIQRCIDEGMTVERANGVFLTAIRDRDPAVSLAPAQHSHSREKDMTRNVIHAAALMRAGQFESTLKRVPESERSGLEQASEMAHRVRDISIPDMCRELSRIDKARDPVSGVEPYSRDEHVRAAVSGGSLSYVFTQLVGAVVLSAFADAPDTTVGWTSEGENPDFKATPRMRLKRKKPGMKKHARGQEAEHTSVSDTGETVKVERFSEQFVLDEMDMIDDSFNMLTSPDGTLMELALDAARLRPDLVYSLLLANPTLGADSKAVFHDDHSNLITSSPLTRTNLQTLLTRMATQTENSVALGLFGKFLLVPQALKFLATQLIQSSTLVITGDTDSEIGAMNPLTNEELIVRADQRLDNGVWDASAETQRTGSATDYYLASRGGRHTIEVTYRAGTSKSPQIRGFTLDKGQWGLGWDINYDIAATVLGYRGLAKGQSGA